jgi:hypothetical protein
MVELIAFETMATIIMVDAGFDQRFDNVWYKSPLLKFR